MTAFERLGVAFNLAHIIISVCKDFLDVGMSKRLDSHPHSIKYITFNGVNLFYACSCGCCACFKVQIAVQ